jgi:hypothetical protein
VRNTGEGDNAIPTQGVLRLEVGITHFIVCGAVERDAKKCVATLLYVGQGFTKGRIDLRLIALKVWRICKAPMRLDGWAKVDRASPTSLLATEGDNDIRRAIVERFIALADQFLGRDT